MIGRHRPVSLSRPMPYDVVQHRASRHPALSYDVVRSVNTALVSVIRYDTIGELTWTRKLSIQLNLAHVKNGKMAP